VWPQGLGQRSPAPFGHATWSEQQAQDAAAKPPGLKGAL
jgi:hypothetical protein